MAAATAIATTATARAAAGRAPKVWHRDDIHAWIERLTPEEAARLLPEELRDVDADTRLEELVRTFEDLEAILEANFVPEEGGWAGASLAYLRQKTNPDEPNGQAPFNLAPGGGERPSWRQLISAGRPPPLAPVAYPPSDLGAPLQMSQVPVALPAPKRRR